MKRHPRRSTAAKATPRDIEIVRVYNLFLDFFEQLAPVEQRVIADWIAKDIVFDLPDQIQLKAV